MSGEMRVGFGYDVHKFSRGRKLMLGGIKIRHKYGLLGHSDADVLLHSICDALLGALGFGDIGIQFPDTDPAYKDISSIRLLERVMQLVRAEKFKVDNCDCVIIAQSPKITFYRSRMIRKISTILGTKKVNVKATTNEGLGFIGKNRGIASLSAILLKKH